MLIEQAAGQDTHEQLWEGMTYCKLVEAVPDQCGFAAAFWSHQQKRSPCAQPGDQAKNDIADSLCHDQLTRWLWIRCV